MLICCFCFVCEIIASVFGSVVCGSVPVLCDFIMVSLRICRKCLVGTQRNTPLLSELQNDVPSFKRLIKIHARLFLLLGHYTPANIPATEPVVGKRAIGFRRQSCRCSGVDDSFHGSMNARLGPSNYVTAERCNAIHFYAYNDVVSGVCPCTIPVVRYSGLCYIFMQQVADRIRRARQRW